MDLNDLIQVPTLTDTHSHYAAHERVKAEIEAVPDSALLSVNLDIPNTALMIIGHHPRLVTLRDALAVAVRGSFDVAKLDKLPDYAKATWHAHISHQQALRSPPALQELNDVAQKQVVILMSDLKALVARQLIRADVLEQPGTPNGYKATAHALNSLVNIFRTHADVIRGKTAVTEEDLEAASYTAGKLVEAYGARETGAAADIDKSSLHRQRAYSLLLNTYDEIRREVAHLRWHEEDANWYAPSPFSGRRRKPDEAEPTPTLPVAAPVPPAASTPIAVVPAAAPGAPVTEPFVS